MACEAQLQETKISLELCYLVAIWLVRLNYVKKYFLGTFLLDGIRLLRLYLLLGGNMACEAQPCQKIFPWNIHCYLMALGF
jgi:hypothetical protein